VIKFGLINIRTIITVARKCEPQRTDLAEIEFGAVLDESEVRVDEADPRVVLEHLRQSLVAVLLDVAKQVLDRSEHRSSPIQY
jgi:hypothetical protein